MKCECAPLLLPPFPAVAPIGACSFLFGERVQCAVSCVSGKCQRCDQAKVIIRSPSHLQHFGVHPLSPLSRPSQPCWPSQPARNQLHTTPTITGRSSPSLFQCNPGHHSSTSTTSTTVTHTLRLLLSSLATPHGLSPIVCSHTGSAIGHSKHPTSNAL